MAKSRNSMVSFIGIIRPIRLKTDIAKCDEQELKIWATAQQRLTLAKNHLNLM
jgi:hypothetical protein